MSTCSSVSPLLVCLFICLFVICLSYTFCIISLMFSYFYFASRTPLQCASYGGFVNSMTVLLENGSDPNARDSEVSCYTSMFLYCIYVVVVSIRESPQFTGLVLPAT